jgi:hypothetical protein
MRFKHLLAPALLVCYLLICSFRDPDKFNNGGVSFSIPAGWEITDQEDLDGAGYYLSCEKTGVNASGLVTVSWVNEERSLAEIAVAYADNLTENFVAKKADPKMSAQQKSTYNNIPAVKMGYTMKLMGTSFHGTIYCFHLCDKTITVLVQEADEDVKENKAGIHEIEGSFKCGS